MPAFVIEPNGKWKYKVKKLINPCKIVGHGGVKSGRKKYREAERNNSKLIGENDFGALYQIVLRLHTLIRNKSPGLFKLIQNDKVFTKIGKSGDK